MTHEWDAEAYHRISKPQQAWGRAVLARAGLRGDETVVDAGCGSGRLTAELLDRLPHGHVIAVDASKNMVAQAAAALEAYGERVRFVHADLAQLDLDAVADLIFSTATFHWVLDQEALARSLYRALKPGGRLVAQCGGRGNLAGFLAHVRAVMARPEFRAAFADWHDRWIFVDPDTAAARLRQVGFVDVDAALQLAPTPFADADAFREFVSKVVCGHHLEVLPAAQRAPFIDAVMQNVADSGSGWQLDYVRLNLQARRAAAI